MRTASALALVSALVFAAPLAAQTADFKFVSGGSVTNSRALGSYGANSFFVGPYTGTETVGSSTSNVFLYCVDFAHDIHVGDVWNANLTSLAGPLGGRTRFSDATLYQQAAWLTMQYALNPTRTEDIQDAIWYLFQPTLWSSTNTAFAGASTWVTKARLASNYGAINLAEFRVVTDNSPSPLTGEKQEFLIRVTSTPEPASLVLLGTGLLGVYGAARRRRALG